MPSSRFIAATALLGAIAFTSPALGQVASVPFEEGFESGVLADYWQVVTTSAALPGSVGTVTVSNQNGPATGTYHLELDSATDGINSVAEAILAVDLEGKSGILFEFSQREYSDEPDVEDGVWISDDGVNWAQIVDLGALGSAVYQTFTFDLDEEVSGAGMSFTNPFYIKFSWSDEYGIATDGFAFDDIRLRTLDYTTLRAIPGPDANGNFGQSMAPVGDMDGDGFNDMAVGAPGWSANKGSISIHSGLDGSPIAGKSPGQASARFGATMINIGDVTGDGLDELLIGAPGSNLGGIGAGSVFVYSYVTNTFAYAIHGSQAGEALGTSVGFMGDSDGDGFPELLVGSPNATVGGSPNTGLVQVFSGASGQPLLALEGMQAGEMFGSSVSSTSDVDGDGVDEIIVGAPFRSLLLILNDLVGSADVISGATGATVKSFYGDTIGSEFGTSVLGLGDQDGDGLGDIAVGAPAAEGETGMVRICSPAKFEVIETLSGLFPMERFGHVLATVGDITGDGLANFAVGTEAQTIGSVTVYRISDLKNIYRFEPLLPGTGFGQAVAGAGDLNEDGLGDIMVGAPLETAGGMPDAGYMRVLTTASAPIFEDVVGVHSTMSGELVVSGQSLLKNLQVEIDGIGYPTTFISPAEARVAVGPNLKGGYHDIRVLTDLGDHAVEDIVPRFPALKSGTDLPLSGQLNVQLNNGDEGSYILAYSNNIFPSPALFENFGWFYGLELSGVWMLDAGIFGVDDYERLITLTGPSAANLVGEEFYLQAWTYQSNLGLIGFSNTTQFTIVP
jgi:hypothetical protein